MHTPKRTVEFMGTVRPINCPSSAEQELMAKGGSHVETWT